MLIKFYGVRGSIATPGINTTRYGGNTACVSLRTSDNYLFVFDAGTGLKDLGNELFEKPSSEDIYFLFSHFHWDHIQGFPFFLPAYQKDQNIKLITTEKREKGTHAVLKQMIEPHFPVSAEKLKANVEELFIRNGKTTIGQNKITTQIINHPGGGTAYRVETQSGSLAYVTDNELFPPSPAQTTYEEWVMFVNNVDILIHDAMYLDHESEKVLGWGHSIIPQVLQLAGEANVSRLILFHHDPSRTDEQLDEIQRASQYWMKKHFPSCKVSVAKEGDEYLVKQSARTEL